ncbi:C40 family peptidase [Leifsonia poae]|uniref:C40 family peptidase n=1 Tax=Leifsonia poae TaxID=110933 RepID=UPI003D66A3CE
MTVTDALSRIAQIQSTLVQLENPTKVASTSSTSSSATSGTSATDFADALAGALGTTDASSTLGDGTVTGADVVADAKKYLGVPYVFGGTTSAGIDCSGLVQRVYKDLGIDVPRLVSGQAKLGTEVPSLAQAQPGDLIVTGGGEHILIYAGDHKVIHAPRPGKDVRLVEAYMDDSQIDTIRRVVPQASTATASAAASSASGLFGSGLSNAQASALQSLFQSMLSGASL